MIFCEQVSTSVPAVIICDRCGRRLEKQAHGFEFQEALCLRFVGGYASVWGDGSKVEVDLCQQCGYEMLQPFARANGEPYHGT